jgi:hypothetical protein
MRRYRQAPIGLSQYSVRLTTSLFALLMPACVPNIGQKPSSSQVDFAARGKDNTLLLTPVRLPAFAQIDEVGDKSRGYACAFTTAKNAVNSTFAAMSDEALAKLADPRPYKDKLQVLTPFPVPAASAIQILLTQTAQSRIRQIRAETAARAGAEADKQEGDVSAATGLTGAAGGGAVVLKEALEADQLGSLGRGITNINIIEEGPLTKVANAIIISDFIDSFFDQDRYRRSYSNVQGLDWEQLENKIRQRVPNEIRVAPPHSAASKAPTRQVLQERMRSHTDAIKRLQILARDHRSFNEFNQGFTQLSKELDIDIPFNAAAVKNAPAGEKIVEMIASIEALDVTVKAEQATLVEGLRIAGLMPKSSNFWDQFKFRLDEVAKSPWGKVKIAAAIAAGVGVLVGGGFMIKRALSLPNLDGIVNLSDEEIGRAEQQLLKLGIDYPVTKSYTCKQALGL